MFSKAIVCQPCPEMIRGITSASLGTPDYQKALDQHGRYVDVLRNLGLEVKVLEADPDFPDSVFVEDVALCTPACAIVTNPGAPSRNGEQLKMRPHLEHFYPRLESIEPPGTLDAGDVMMVGSHYFIGISKRTNSSGAKQLIRILKQHSMTASMIPLKEILHLKSGVSSLEENTLLIGPELIHHPDFKAFHKIEVDPHESYAANSLWINSTVLVPAGFPNTRDKIDRAGYSTITLEVTEFEKLDGGLSCLSLRF